MMRLAELCIGNYVMVNGEIHMVTAIYGEKKAVSLDGREFLTYVNDLEPIPMSVELLEDAGFEEESVQDYHFRLWNSKDGRIEISYWIEDRTRDVHIDNESYETVGGCIFKYVHELQNMYTLCGYEVKFIVKGGRK